MDEWTKLTNALDEYGKAFNAEFYLIVFYPEEKGKQVEVPGSFSAVKHSRGAAGELIKQIVEREVLHRKIE